MGRPLLDDKWPGSNGDCPCVQIFSLLIDILQNDVVLKNVGINWRTWRGDARDAMRPTERELPWIRLTPVRTAVSLSDEDSRLAVFRVKFEIVVRGTHWNDLGNLSYYFRSALRYNRAYNGTNVLQAFRNVGATVFDIVDSGMSPIRAEATIPEPSQPGGGPDGPADQVSVGMISFQVFETALD